MCIGEGITESTSVVRAQSDINCLSNHWDSYKYTITCVFSTNGYIFLHCYVQIHQRSTRHQGVKGPKTACTTENDGDIHPKPDGDIIWICMSGEWKPYT